MGSLSPSMPGATLPRAADSETVINAMANANERVTLEDLSNEHEGSNTRSNDRPEPIRRIVYSQGNPVGGGRNKEAELPPDYFVGRNYSYDDNLKPANGGTSEVVGWLKGLIPVIIFVIIGFFMFVGFEASSSSPDIWENDPFTGPFVEFGDEGQLTFDSEEELDEWLEEHGTPIFTE